MLVSVSDPQKDSELSLLYPGNGSADPKVVSLLKGLKRGSKIIVSANRFQGKGVLTSIEACEVKEGEDKPGVFIFMGTKTDKEGTVGGVTLERFFKTQTLPVRLVKDSTSGTRVRDPDICKTLGELKQGDLVYADADNVQGTTVLASIEPYRPPLKGEFVQVVPRKVGQPQTTVEIQVDSKKEVFEVPNKDISGVKTPDPQILAAIRKLKPGQAVEFRADRNNNRVLMGIWPAKE